MPLGAYIEGYRRISPVLPRPLSGRTLSSPALTNGEDRRADILVENCRFMRRDVSPAASLRTGSLSGAAVSDSLQNQISLGKRLPARLHTIPAFPSIVFPAKLSLLSFSHRLLQVIPYLDIFVEICSPMMPLGAYIKGYRCISPVLPRPMPGRMAFPPA